MDSRGRDQESATMQIHPSFVKLKHNLVSAPLELCKLEAYLNLDSVIKYSDQVFKDEEPYLSDDLCEEKYDDPNSTKKSHGGFSEYSYKNEFTAEEWKEENLKFYNLKSVGTERQWLQNVLLSDDDSDDSSSEITEEDYKEMLKIHACSKKINKSFSKHPDIYQEKYGFYGSSLILEHDKYHDRQKKRNKTVKLITSSKKKSNNESSSSHTKTSSSSVSSASSAAKAQAQAEIAAANAAKLKLEELAMVEQRRKLMEAKLKKLQIRKEKDLIYKRRKLWNIIAKKEIPKASRARANRMGTAMQTLKKVAQTCQREAKKEAVRSQKVSKETILRARKMAKEMLLYWRRFDKVEKEHRKKAEKEAMEQRRQDEEMREMKRQQRKLNFLITQTELYAHFMGRKMKGGSDATQENAVQNEILKKLDDQSPSLSQHSVHGGVVVNTAQDDYDSDAMKTQAILNAQNAVLMQEKKINLYDGPEKKPASQNSFDNTFSLANPSAEIKQHPQPKIFNGKLKSYQLKGMNWIVNLYEQGINGILADEMGLGKTVQSIVFLAYLAEIHDIWGPFLVVAPASTLHNWQQEFTRFLPSFKVLPYWGDPGDRKSLRKFWNQKSSYMNDAEDAPFHVLITSYQLIVSDVKYFQRIKWQYLVLDEAHAIKSSTSIRWKILLGYNCRNRLLLTGTPIQNTMAELWALLHFIMPTLFDSHDEFNEWFSKDIENHASERKPNLDQNQLSRLHMILKPFMLRRIKKDVENELSEKIEIKVMCDMSIRQRQLYQAVKNKIMFEDLLQSANTNTDNKSTSLLMNLVMQFRKVCNHPDIFERKEATCGLFFKLPPYHLPKMLYRSGFLTRDPIENTNFFDSIFLIWNSAHIHHTLQTLSSNCFSFTRFIDISPHECYDLFKNLVSRIRYTLLALKFLKQQQQQNTEQCIDKNTKKYLTRRDLLIFKHKPQTSSNALDLCFIKHNKNFAGHHTVLISEIKTKNSTRLDTEPIKRDDIPVSYPHYLASRQLKVVVPPHDIYCSDRSAAYEFSENIHGPPDLIKVLESGADTLTHLDRNKLYFPPPYEGLDSARPYHGWSNVKMPDRCSLLTDCGKLMVLDQLLFTMKRDDHRVLIYSQMTKMIDILEEFMNYRQYKYMRLDGSSKIADRRDMVANFQANDDIFVFLLSTRAGGLGINLTAADTVIFYDSDWNPTVDQQAMDRAHRLGQTRQVTVYRLVTKGTIEEKILNRAREKSEIQNIVISGGQFNKDVLRPKEVVSLLLDDEELEKKLKQRQVEKKVAEESGKRPGRKRKTAQETDSVQDKKLKTNEVESVHHDSSSNNTENLDIDENSVSSLDFNVLTGEDYTENSSQPLSAMTNSPNPSPNVTPASRVRSGKGVARVIKVGGPPVGRGSPPVLNSNGTVVSTPKGRGKSKSGTLAEAAASAAAAAGAAAGSAAAYAAYGYSFQAVHKPS